MREIDSLNVLCTEGENLSKRLTPKESIKHFSVDTELPKIVTIAVACFDISSLVCRGLKVYLTEQCHHPDICLYLMSHPYQESNFTDVINSNEMLWSIPNKEYQVDRTLESVYITHNTSLTFGVNFMVPQYPSIHLHKQCDKAFKRIFAIIYNEKLATELLRKVMLHNQEEGGSEVIVTGIFKKFKQFLPGKHINFEKCLTGWCIDNGSEFMVYLEGPSNGYILTIWNMLHKITLPNASIHLNSSHIFRQRLYHQFIPQQPVYLVTLAVPLRTLVASKKSFIRGHLSYTQFEALKKLSLLLNAKTMKEMLNYNLFPNAFEIVSLAVEFGVPMRSKLS